MTSLRKQIDNVALSLSRYVSPALDDELARGQILAAVDILLDISRKADWAPDYLNALHSLQEETMDRVATIFADHRAAPPFPLGSVGEGHPSGQALKERIEETDARICDLLDFADATTVPGLSHAIVDVLRDYMSRQTKIENDFSHHPELEEIASHDRG